MNTNENTCVFNQGINMHTLPITSTKLTHGKFDFKYGFGWCVIIDSRMQHKFENVNLINMRWRTWKTNRITPAYLSSVIFGAPNLAASPLPPPPNTNTVYCGQSLILGIPHLDNQNNIFWGHFFFFFFRFLETRTYVQVFRTASMTAFTFLQHVPLAKLMTSNGTYLALITALQEKKRKEKGM